MSLVLVSLLIFSGSTVNTELTPAVQTYWNLLEKGDKIGALEYVVLRGRNAFIRRREPPFRSWKLIKIEPRSQQEALVTVEIDQLLVLAGTYYPMPVKESWVREEGRWRVRVVQPTPDMLKNLYTGQSETPEEPGVPHLEVLPNRVKIHFLDRSQKGLIQIQNNLHGPVWVSRIEFDQTRFELLETGESIGPGQKLKVIFRYIGKESQKQLKSEVRLFLKRGLRDSIGKDKEELFAIPVLYNYVSPGARGLLGLTQEKLLQLERGEHPAPVLSMPAKSGSSPDIPGVSTDKTKLPKAKTPTD